MMKRKSIMRGGIRRLMCMGVMFCMVFFCNAIVVRKEGPDGTSLDVVQEQLQAALVKELAKPSMEGGPKANFNTTVTMDTSHNLRVEAQANITTQTETHVVVTTGNPADAPVIQLIKRMISLKQELTMEEHRLSKRHEYVGKHCGKVIDRVIKYIEAVRPKNSTLPENLEENPFPCDDCTARATAEAVIVIDGIDGCGTGLKSKRACKNILSVEKSEYSERAGDGDDKDETVAFLQTGPAEIATRVRDLLQSAKASADRVVDEGDESFEDLAKDLAKIHRAAEKGAYNIDGEIAGVKDKIENAQTILNDLEPLKPTGLAVMDDPSKRADEALIKAYERAIAFRLALVKQCDGAVSLLEKQSKEVEDELSQVEDIGIQLTGALDPLAALTFHDAELAENESEETKAASKFDAVLGALGGATKMRRNAIRAQHDALEVAVKLQGEAERVEGEELKIKTKYLSLRTKEFLMTRCVDEAESFAHNEMAHASIALRCALPSDEGAEESDEDEDAEVEETLNRMSATVKAALAKARQDVRSETTIEDRSSEERRDAFASAQAAEDAAETLLHDLLFSKNEDESESENDSSSSPSFLQLRESEDDGEFKCVRTWSRGDALKLKRAADASAEEASKYIHALVYLRKKTHDEEVELKDAHEASEEASNKWTAQGQIVSRAKRAIEEVDILVDGFRSKMEELRATAREARSRVASTDEVTRDALTNFRSVRLLAVELLTRLVDVPEGVDQESMKVESGTASFLETGANTKKDEEDESDANASILDDIESKMADRAESQRQRWASAFEARGDLLQAAKKVREAEGKMKIARLKMMQRQMDYEVSHASARDEADGAEVSSTSEMAASAAASAGAFLRAKEARESLNDLSQALRLAARKSDRAIRGHVGDAPLPGDVEKRWRASESSVHDVIEDIIKNGVEAYTAKGSYEASLARMHAATSTALRSAVKGQESMENEIDRLQKGYAAIVDEDEDVEKRQSANEERAKRSEESNEERVRRAEAEFEAFKKKEKEEIVSWRAHEDEEVSEWKKDADAKLETFKTGVRSRLAHLSQDVDAIRRLLTASRIIRKKHNATLHEHQMKLASTSAQLSHLKAIVAGVDLGRLGLDSSEPDVAKLSKAAKLHEKFFEDEVLSGYRKNIDAAHEEMTDLTKAMKMSFFEQDETIVDADVEFEFEEYDFGTGATGATGGAETDEGDVKTLTDRVLELVSRPVQDDDGKKDLSSVTREFVQIRSVSGDFHRYAVRTQHAAAEARRAAEASDRAFVAARSKRDDTLKYAQQLKDALKEKDELVHSIQAALSLGTLDEDELPGLRKELEAATFAKDETFTSTQDAAVAAESAEGDVQSTHDKRYDAWRNAHKLAEHAKEVAQLSAQLQVVSARAVVRYTDALLAIAQKETASQRARVLKSGRASFAVLGDVDPSQFSDGPSADDLRELAPPDIPAPLGTWTPPMDPSTDRDVEGFVDSLDPDGEIPSSATGIEGDVEVVVDRSVDVLKEALSVQNALRQKMWADSEKIGVFKAHRKAMHEQVEDGHSNEELASQLGLLIVKENGIEREFEALKEDYVTVSRVIAKLEDLLAERLRLRMLTQKLERRHHAAAEAVRMLEDIEEKAARGMLSASNAAMEDRVLRDEEKREHQRETYEGTVMKQYGLDSDALITSFLQMSADEDGDLNKAITKMAMATSDLDFQDKGEVPNGLDGEDEDALEETATGPAGFVHGPNIGHVMSGSYHDIVLPDWHEMNPAVASRVAEAALDHAKEASDMTEEELARAAHRAEVAKQAASVMERKYDEITGHFNVMRNSMEKAGLLSEAFDGMYSDATGAAWEEMGLTGSAGNFELLDEATSEEAKHLIAMYRHRKSEANEDLDDARAKVNVVGNLHKTFTEQREETEAEQLEAKVDLWESEAEHERMDQWKRDTERMKSDASEWAEENRKAAEDAALAAREEEEALVLEEKAAERNRQRPPNGPGAAIAKRLRRRRGKRRRLPKRLRRRRAK